MNNRGVLYQVGRMLSICTDTQPLQPTWSTQELTGQNLIHIPTPPAFSFLTKLGHFYCSRLPNVVDLGKDIQISPTYDTRE